MFSRYIGALFTALSLAVAQQSSVPSDLSGSFDPSSITLQVLYSDTSKTDLHGVGDGSTISQKETTQSPSFSFGDASEVNFSLVTMILLVDTTTSNRQLHFLQTGFTATQDATSITSTDKPLVPYAAPGTLGEPSGTRKYSWLLFQQTGNLKASSLKAGNFDVQSFISSNNLQPALAGIEMNVPVQAQGNSNGGSTSAAAQSTSISPATSKVQTSTVQTSSPATTQAQPTSTIPVITIPASTKPSSSSISSSTQPPSQSAAAAASSSTPVTTVSLSTSTPPAVTLTTFVSASGTSSATSSISTAAAPRLFANKDGLFGTSWLALGAVLITQLLVSGGMGVAVFTAFA